MCLFNPYFNKKGRQRIHNKQTNIAHKAFLNIQVENDKDINGKLVLYM